MPMSLSLPPELNVEHLAVEVCNGLRNPLRPPER